MVLAGMVMDRYAIACRGQRSWRGADQGKTEFCRHIDQIFLVAGIQRQRLIQITDGADALVLVMHQVEHGQPGHQLGHQYGAVGGRTVYLGEGLLLLILLTYHKLQAKQIGDTEPLPGIALIKQGLFGAIQSHIIQHALLIKQIEALPVST